MADSPHISVVIPVRNEEADVAALTEALESVLRDSFEIIFVDDGSTDETWERLKPLHVPGRMRLIRFRRNFGKTAALAAGLAASRGEVVITMDGDQQDDPAEIPHFLEKLEQGYRLVVGWKKIRRDPASKVIASRLFNAVIRKTTGLDLHDINCGFKAFDGEVARSLKLHGELHRFIPALVAAQGYPVTEIEVTHHARRHGRSKYGFSRLFKGFFDLVTVLLITRFGERPAHLFGFAALPLLCLGVIFLVLTFLPVPDWHFGMLATLLCLGALILMTGGWLAELTVAQQARSGFLPVYSVEEQLD